MFVCIEAPHSVVSLEAFILQQLKNVFFIRNLIVSNDEPFVKTNWLMLLEPGMRSYVIYLIALFWIRVQNFLEEVCCVFAHEAGNLEFSTEDLLVEF